MTISIAVWMFPVLMLCIFMGFPVALSLFGTAFLFGLLRWPPESLAQVLTTKVYDVTNNYVLAAIPLFIFMGAMLERAGIATRLFDAIHLWTRQLPGGLAVGTVLMCVVFAAASGVLGATESVVGLLAIPAMLKHAYDKGLISGTICAGGSLGTIIPPSIVVVLLGPVASVSVGDLFIGMLIPGLLIAGLYILYILGLCTVLPRFGPRLPPDAYEPPLLTKLAVTFRALVPPVLLIVAVLGSIMIGAATPTEAAATGAAGTVLLTLFYRTFTFYVLKEALIRTLLVTSMILMIYLGGMMFSGVFVATGGMTLIEDLMQAAGLGPWSTIFVILALAFLAGFFLDMISIILVFVPISVLLMRQFGFDVVWFSILFLIVIQTSYLTPPMAPAIFYLRGISPPEIKLGDMYRGVIPFIILELIALALVMAYPNLALWLPGKVLGFN
ncbi:MAG: TRAP transporter large permease subunit [Alphaproteobacteria bacterium]|jgi:tripartite ATP-independent transporter DctM subunit|nr:TRAP transporter large permease subunit [Alphaproteobacteria bacterium]